MKSPAKEALRIAELIESISPDLSKRCEVRWLPHLNRYEYYIILTTTINGAEETSVCFFKSMGENEAEFIRSRLKFLLEKSLNEYLYEILK